MFFTLPANGKTAFINSFYMNSNRVFSYRSSGNPLGMIIALLITAGIIYLLFMAVGLAIKLLLYAAPVLFIATLVINYRVVLDYFQGLVQSFRRHWPSGLFRLALTLLAFPIVIAWLFFKALLFKKMAQTANSDPYRSGSYSRESEQVDYEELETRTLDTSEKLQADTQPRQDDNRYDQLFDR